MDDAGANAMGGERGSGAVPQRRCRGKDPFGNFWGEASFRVLVKAFS